MKKAILTTVLLAILFIAACASEPTAPQRVPAQASAPTAANSETAKKIDDIQAQAPGCRVAETATAELKKIMENKNEIVKMALGVNSYLSVKKGECVIFPVGIRNEFLEAKQFFLDVQFAEAKDRAPIANVMTADKNIMNSWLSETDFSKKTIRSHEYTIIPIKVTVGDMITADSPTVIGTYKFFVQAYFAKGEVSKEAYEPQKEIFVRVTE